MLVLDSGGLSRLSERTQQAAALIMAFRRDGHWPPVVPSVVIAESTSGSARVDTNVNRLLRACDVVTDLPVDRARRAGRLRARARRGSAVDAIVVALAEPGAIVLTSDRGDLEALAAHADGVVIQSI